MVSAMHELRVLTLNIWNRSDPWEDRLALIREGIEVLSPDLIALQEVINLGDDFDQAALIADGFGYARTWGKSPASDLPFGNAILSRWPIAETQVMALPKIEDEEDRSLVHAQIAAPFGTVHFFNTHLAWRLHEGHVRAAQMKFIAKVIEGVPEHEFPPILVGDFNAEPDADEVRYLRGLTTLGEARGVSFLDAYSFVNSNHTGYTFSRENAFTLSAGEPSRRIDYIFVRGPDGRRRAEPTSANVCFDAQRDGVWASDHFGVFVTLRT